MMIPRIRNASYVRDYVIQITFDDGKSGLVDLKDELYGEVFEPLLDKQYFRAFSVNNDIHTIVWENGADFAPEFLYERAMQVGKH